MPVNITFPLSIRLGCAFLCAIVATGCQSTGTPGTPFSLSRTDKLRNPTRTHLAFAKLSEKTGDLKAARDSYQTVLKHDPQSVAATIGMASVELRAGRATAAEREFLKARTLAPQDPLVNEALGQFYLSEHRYSEAEHYLSEGLRGSPGNHRLQYRLGVALANQGQINKAEQLFVQAIGEAEADYNIGLILYEQGQTEIAEQRLLQAVIKKPELSQAQHWLQVVRTERTQTTPAEPQSPGPALPHGAVSQVSGSEHTQQAALGSLTLAARQALARQQTAHTALPGSEEAGGTTGRLSRPVQPDRTSQPYHQTLDTSRMTATQQEQLANSLLPEQSGGVSVPR